MKSETLFLFENAAWPALLLDNSGRIRRFSVGAKNLFGLSAENTALVSETIWSDQNGSTAEDFFIRWQKKPDPTVELKLRTKNGEIVPYTVHLCSLQKEDQTNLLLQIFPKDRSGSHFTSGSANPAEIAVLKNSEATPEAVTAHKQKLDCALQLSRSVALDFNNALTSILGHTSHILGRIEPSNAWRNSLLEIEKSAEKAAEIAHDLASFSRQEKDSRAQLAGNLNQLVRRTVELFKASQNPEISWNLQLENKLYTANFEEAKMQQAFLKVLENAVQSASRNGRIGVTTSNKDFIEPESDGNIQVQPGCYVCVEFNDNGCGIPADILPRVFEPFFTTKNNPANRGLGLAWVYGIVTNHSGSVAISSTPNEGTAVRIYLPALKRIVKDHLAPSKDLTGTQTVLVIDDEDVILTLGEMVLSSYGYRVFTASNGINALEIFKNCGGKIDLVITDLVMPQMSGREVIEKLRAIDPDLKIICASGFMRSNGSEDDQAYLQKPFTAQDLLTKVKEILAA
jgi:two-component system cell cycle sensor histidine kinase/response regulator CckA